MYLDLLRTIFCNVNIFTLFSFSIELCSQLFAIMLCAQVYKVIQRRCTRDKDRFMFLRYMFLPERRDESHLVPLCYRILPVRKSRYRRVVPYILSN